MSSIRELTSFLGLQVKQKKDGIFISHDKYVAEILRKFRLADTKSASTHINMEKPLLKDPNGEDVDVHTYKSMIGSLIYLTLSSPAIMFAVGACVNDVTRLQALVDKKKVVVTKATIREALRLDDEKGRNFNFSKYIFDSLVRNVDSTSKFYMYPCFLQLVIRKQVGDLLTHTTKYTSRALTQKVFANMRRVGDADGNDETVNDGDATEGDVTIAYGKVQPTLPQSPQRVVLEDDKEVADEAKKVADVVKDVKESSQDQGRITESQEEIYKTNLDHANKVLSMQEDETRPAEVQEEVVDVVTTAKLITKVVTAASKTITAASTSITAAEAQVLTVTLIVAPARVTAAPSRRRKGVVIRDPEEDSTTSTIILAETKSKDKELQAELNKNIDWDEVIDHVKKKAKEHPANVAGFKMDYFKGMSYNDIRPIFEAKFNLNVAFLLKTKEQIEEDENRALKRLNETLTERATKKQKLDEKVEELKRHLQIVPNEDDDVYTEATPLTQKVPVVNYQIIELNNKPYYKIIRADDTHQLYKTQRNVHGSAKVKGWKLLESCGVQIITFTSTQLILLVERKCPLTRFTLAQMLNAVRLKVEEESEVSLELLRFTRQQHQEGQ
nr:hypothetical protein [Tanacetum cinerariifolium]